MDRALGRDLHQAGALRGVERTEQLDLAGDPFDPQATATVAVRGAALAVVAVDALVPEAKAIQLLGYDDHAEVVPLVRDVYERATGVAREEALRVLATDPESEQLFTRLLNDKSEKRSVRQLSASGLQSLNPEAFDKAARKIIADEDDYNDIRATALAALAHGREAHETPFDPKLVETVQKVGESTKSRSIRSAARRFLQSTEQ